MMNNACDTKPQWEDQLWDILHAMLYRSIIALIPLMALLFQPSHTPLMEAMRFLALLGAIALSLTITRSQQKMLRQLRNKYDTSNQEAQGTARKLAAPDRHRWL